MKIKLAILLLFSSLRLMSQEQERSSSDTTPVKMEELGTVTVKGQKPLYQQKPEGITVNVESSVLSKGSSALQVLERSPGVMIDHRNNSIDLNGKTGVMVMINGKLLRMNSEQVVSFLNSMSANDIEKIELLTTPPANYDAEGSAGLINIVLKKNKKMGTNGSASITGGYGKGEKATASLNLSHITGKLNLYGRYTYSRNRTYSDMYITGTQNMPFLGGRASVVFLDTTKLLINNHDASAGIDFKLTPKISIGGSMNLNYSNSSSIDVTDAAYNVFPDSLLQFDGINRSGNRWTNRIYSAYLEKQMNDSGKISFDADYLRFQNDGNSNVTSSFLDKHGVQASNSDTLFAPAQRAFANTTIQVQVAKADYEKQLTKRIKIEAGIKGAFTKSESVSGIESFVNGTWASSNQTTNNIIMKETISAGYATVNSRLDSLTNISVGGRYEYANTQMDNPVNGKNIVSRKMGDFFPSVFFSRKLNEQSELQISYTKRITRPSYNDLASYVGYSDPTAVYTGNPFLKPTVTNNLKFGYNYRGYSFSLLFSRDKNPIARYQLSESPNADILYISPQNLAWQNNITFQTNLPFKIGNWWNMSYGFVGGLKNYREEYSIQPLEKSYFGYSLNASETFKMPYGFSTELSAWYNSDFFNGTVKVKGYTIVNLGLKKELKNNNGSFQFSVSDLFRNEYINVFYGSLTQEAFEIKSHVAIQTESRKFPILKLTYSKSFGSGLPKNQRNQNSQSRDEQDRIQKN